MEVSIHAPTDFLEDLQIELCNEEMDMYKELLQSFETPFRIRQIVGCVDLSLLATSVSDNSPMAQMSSSNCFAVFMTLSLYANV